MSNPDQAPEPPLPQVDYDINITEFLCHFKDQREGMDRALDLITLANVAIRATGVVLMPLVDYDSIVKEDKSSNDDKLIEDAIIETLDTNAILSDAAVRMIASQYHEGQGSAMYQLASTGAINFERLIIEISRAYATEGLSRARQYWITSLLRYVQAREDHGPIEGWSKLWLDRDSKNRSTLFDRANALYEEGADWRRFTKEFTRDELIGLWEQCTADLGVGFDDEVYDALANEYKYFEGGES